ncbi:MAG TPA: nucleoside deaminase [Cyclobacteriaceae bacterium]|nr:nucleoside deaminase [Cyclobacteriaceae bacterium]
MPVNTDAHFMKEALKLAARAMEEDEIPVGAVMVCKNRIISRGYNQTEKLSDSTAHAEMIAITGAFNSLGTKYLPECTLYVTLEPCPMCAGASFWAQLGRLVYGARDEKRGYSNFGGKLLHPSTEVVPGILAGECEKILKSYFQALRK